MQYLNPQFLHYKNAIYNGFLQQNRRQGLGIILLDSSILVIANQKADQLTSTALVWFSYDTYFIGQFNKNSIDGPFVIRSPDLTIYSAMNMNSITHDVLVINRKRRTAKLWNIQGNQGYCAKQVALNEYDTQISIIKNLAPYVSTIPNSIDFLKKQFGKMLIITQNNQSIGSTIPGTKFSSSGRKQYWVEIKSSNSKKIGFKIYNEQLISCGISQNGVLNGLGFKRDNISQDNLSHGIYYEGQFSKNRLHGQGAKQDYLRTLYGSFTHGDIRSVVTLSQQTQSVKFLLMKLKKKIHIHALQFTNTYISQRPFLLLLDFLRLIEQQEQRQIEKIDYERQSIDRSAKSSRVKYDSQESRYVNFATSTRHRQKIDELSYNLKQYNVINHALKYKK